MLAITRFRGQGTGIRLVLTRTCGMLTFTQGVRRGVLLPPHRRWVPQPISGVVRRPGQGRGSTPNARAVVEANVFPGRSTVGGKSGRFGEWGKCCVSSASPVRG